MGYSKEVKKAASDLLLERRQRAEREADQRREQIFRQIPRIQEIEREISSSSIRAARAVLSGENAAQKVEELKKINLSLQKEEKELLIKNGFKSDVFEPQYFCRSCNDKGYVEQGQRTIMCSCLKNALVSCACEELNRTAPLSLSKFETFRLDYYSKDIIPEYGISAYSMMSKIFNFCSSYADNFTDNSQSILMTGNTGLGKTHLSLAIANEVIKKGYGVIYTSAPSLMSKLERNHFSKERDESANDVLLECDLLIIDDLGTEFHTQFTVTQLYNIFNSRMLSSKPMIISTNLSIEELERIYSERFVSRLAGSSRMLSFMGSDIRTRNI